MVALLILGFASPVLATDVFDHGAWEQLLARYVDDDGRVAYRRLASESSPLLNDYLGRLATARVDEMAKAEQLAFWINAYNATILAAVLEGYSAEGAFRRINLFKRYSREIGGEKRTPDDIEHRVIRERFQDFRVHFALVCASSSCPKLRREAYVGARLDAQLDEQARRFLSDTTRNHIDPGPGGVKLSKIFDWFKDDFAREGKTLADTLGPYVDAEQAQLLRTQTPVFLDYDWSMNAQVGERPRSRRTGETVGCVSASRYFPYPRGCMARAIGIKAQPNLNKRG